MLLAIKKKKAVFIFNSNQVLFFVYHDRKLYVFFIDYEEELRSLVFGKSFSKKEKASLLISSSNKIKDVLSYKNNHLYLNDKDYVYNHVDNYRSFLLRCNKTAFLGNVFSITKTSSLSFLTKLLGNNFKTLPIKKRRGKDNKNFVQNSCVLYNESIVNKKELKSFFKKIENNISHNVGKLSHDTVLNLSTKNNSSIFYNYIIKKISTAYNLISSQQHAAFAEIFKLKSKNILTQIVLMKANKGKINVYTKENIDSAKIVSYKSLKYMKEKITSKHFYKCRSYIINISYVYRITKENIYFSCLDIFSTKKEKLKIKLSPRGILKIKAYIKKLGEDGHIVFL